MSRTAPLRGAIVGAGPMGRWHADAVARTGHRVALVVDPDARRAAALARRHRGAQVSASLAGLDRRVADVAHICTPAGTHEPLVLRALESGMHALVEKPLAETATATGEMLARAAERGLAIAPVHQFLFQPGVLALCRMLGGSARVLHVDATACTAGAEGRDDAGRDRVALDVIPHALALVARVVAPELSCGRWHALRTAPGELRITGELGRTSISVLVSAAGRPTVNSLRVVTDRWTSEVDLFHGYAVMLRGSPGRVYKAVRPFAAAAGLLGAAGANLVRRAARREPAYPGLRELVRRFYAAAGAGASPPITALEALEVAMVRDRIAASLASGVET